MPSKYIVVRQWSKLSPLAWSFDDRASADAHYAAVIDRIDLSPLLRNTGVSMFEIREDNYCDIIKTTLEV